MELKCLALLLLAKFSEADSSYQSMERHSPSLQSLVHLIQFVFNFNLVPSTSRSNSPVDMEAYGNFEFHFQILIFHFRSLTRTTKQ